MVTEMVVLSDEMTDVREAIKNDTRIVTAQRCMRRLNWCMADICNKAPEPVYSHLKNELQKGIFQPKSQFWLLIVWLMKEMTGKPLDVTTSPFAELSFVWRIAMRKVTSVEADDKFTQSQCCEVTENAIEAMQAAVPRTWERGKR